MGDHSVRLGVNAVPLRESDQPALKKTELVNAEPKSDINVQPKDSANCSKTGKTGKIPATKLTLTDKISNLVEEKTGVNPKKTIDENHSLSKIFIHYETFKARIYFSALPQVYIKYATSKAVSQNVGKILEKSATQSATGGKVALEATVKEGVAAGIKNALAGLPKSSGSELILKQLEGGAKKNLFEKISSSAKGAGEILTKEFTENGVKAPLTMFKKTIPAYGEKAMENSLLKGTEKGLQKVLKNIPGNAGTIASKEIEEAVLKSASEVAAKGTVKWAARISSITPVIGTATGAAITVIDTRDALKKTFDPKINFPSAAFAWATVGLDTASTAANATGIGAPAGMALSVASIITSLASDALKFHQ